MLPRPDDPIFSCEAQGPPSIPNYRILRVLGEGGMGRVYEAEHERLRRRVAIKSFRLERGVPMHEDFHRRFLTEARAMALMDEHENIARVHDLATGQDGGDYIVMELVEGESLQGLLNERGRFPFAEAARLAADVAGALHHAHERGVIHRDVKPANVMVAPSGKVKVMDFGVARVADADYQTKTGMVIGTLEYMSPEQIMGQRDLDARADVYSLAAVLLQLVTGRTPFSDPSAYELAEKICRKPPPRPSLLRPDTPPALERIILKGLAKSPRQRFQSAEEFERALRAFVRGQGATKRGRGIGWGTVALMFGGALAAGGAWSFHASGGDWRGAFDSLKNALPVAISPSLSPSPSPQAAPGTGSAPEAGPETAPEAAPSPSPRATPEPAPETTPAPTRKPTPTPKPSASPTPRPTRQPTPAPGPTPAPASTPKEPDSPLPPANVVVGTPTPGNGAAQARRELREFLRDTVGPLLLEGDSATLARELPPGEGASRLSLELRNYAWFFDGATPTFRFAPGGSFSSDRAEASALVGVEATVNGERKEVRRSLEPAVQARFERGGDGAWRVARFDWPGPK